MQSPGLLQSTGESIFHQRPIEALLHGAAGQREQVRHVHSLGPVRIELPPLPTGGNFLRLWPVREWPEPGLWQHDGYDSYAPPLFVLHDVLVHGSAGILCLGGAVVAESLAFTSPERNAYRALPRGIALPTGAACQVHALPGTHITVLAGGEGDFDHATIEGLARLSAVPNDYIAAARSLLVPEGGAAQAELLSFLDLPPSIAIRRVGLQEALMVETLVLPLSVSGEASFHPCLLDFFRRVSANVPPSSKRLPRRFIVDRRGPVRRGLLNETEVLQSLVRQGFVPVRLEDFALADQVCLFRQAQAIVWPQGANMTSLGFAQPGCVVIELMPDSRVDWRCRNLAALARLHYDCVIGRARKPWRPLHEDSGEVAWEISVQHVVAAVAQAVGHTAEAA